MDFCPEVFCFLFVSFFLYSLPGARVLHFFVFCSVRIFVVNASPTITNQKLPPNVTFRAPPLVFFVNWLMHAFRLFVCSLCLDVDVLRIVSWWWCVLLYLVCNALCELCFALFSFVVMCDCVCDRNPIDRYIMIVLMFLMCFIFLFFVWYCICMAPSQRQLTGVIAGWET